MKVLARLCGVLVFLVSRSAAALVPVVVVVQPTTPDEVATETLTRIQGELVAAGCEVVSIDSRNLAATPGERVEIASIALDALAAFEIVHDADHLNMEIWVADRLSGTPVVRRIDVQLESGSRATSTVAVRAVELLRASLLERLVKSAVQGSTPEQASPINVLVAPPPRIPRLGLEIGPTISESTVGKRPDWLGVARIGYRLSSTFALRASFTGLGPGTAVGGTSGSASLQQQIGTIDVTAGHTHGALRPFASLGMGVHHLDVEGTPALGYLGNRQSYWNTIIRAGAGASLLFYERLTASLETEMALVVPSPVIRIGGIDAARLGRPALAASLTVGVWL